MAVKWAVQSGNWSNPSTWNDGTLPQADDDVYADGKTVTIDQDITVLSLRTTQRSNGIAGGGFVVNSTRVITCTGEGIIAGTSHCLTLASGNYNVTINSNATGGAVNSIVGINNACIGTVTVNGNIIAGITSHTYGIYHASSGTVIVNGNITAGNATNGNASANASSGVLVITGTIIGGTGAGAHGVVNTSSGTVTITGTVIGGTGGAYGVNNGSSGIVTITGTVIGGNGGAGAWNNSTGRIMITGQAYLGPTGVAPVHANNGRIFINGDIINDRETVVTSGAWTSSAGLVILSGNVLNKVSGTGVLGGTVLNGRIAYYNGTQFYTQYAEADAQGNLTGGVVYHDGSLRAQSNFPAPADVRFGTRYGPILDYIGTCHVPAPQSVLYGVPVDNTTGTVTITASDIASAVWGAQRVQYSSEGTFGAVEEWSTRWGAEIESDIAAAVWGAQRAQHTAEGTFGAVGEWSAHLGTEIESDITLKQAIRALLAVLVGRVSGAGTGTESFNAAGSSDIIRVIVEVDEEGNRNAVTLNL